MRDSSSNAWSKLVAIACIGTALAAAGCGAANPADALRRDDRDAAAPIVDPGTPPEDSDASTPATDPGADTDEPGGFLASCISESNAHFCARLGKHCGSVTGRDNCGTRRTVQCGTCPTSQVCTSNNACCTRETDAQFCARLAKNCGTVSATDNCGATRSVNCGTCPSSQVCGANSVCSCIPESDPAFCARLRTTCGALTATDNCGTSRKANCGSCDAAHVCSNSACRLIDGQRGCVTGSDCAGGTCSRFFVDADGDAVGDSTKPVNQCGSTPGVGLSASPNDCCDTNPDVRPLNPPPAPNQGPWFIAAPTTLCPAAHKPFDYDCDGIETMEDPALFNGCTGGETDCRYVAGPWVDTVPPCGQPGTAVACVFLFDGSGCIGFELFTKIQACR